MCWAYQCWGSHQGRHAPPSCLRTHHTWPLPGSIYDHSEADTASWPPSSSQCHYQCEHWSRSSFHPCYLWAARDGAPTQEKDGISLFNISFWTHLVSSHGLYPIILTRSSVLLSIPGTLDSTGNNSGSTKAPEVKEETNEWISKVSGWSLVCSYPSSHLWTEVISSFVKIPSQYWHYRFSTSSYRSSATVSNPHHDICTNTPFFSEKGHLWSW